MSSTGPQDNATDNADAQAAAASVVLAAAVAVGAVLPPSHEHEPAADAVEPDVVVEKKGAVAPALLADQPAAAVVMAAALGAGSKLPPRVEVAPALEPAVESSPSKKKKSKQSRQVAEKPMAEGAAASGIPSSTTDSPPGVETVSEEEVDPDAPVGPPPDETLEQFLDRVTPVVEGLIFAADHPLTMKEIIATLVAEAEVQGSVENVQTVLSRLQSRHATGGITLQEVAGGYAFRTAPVAARYLRRATQEKPFRMGRAALETLAIIAYRQPVTKPQVDELRGVDSAGAIKALLDRNLVKILGKAEEVGRPLLYGTTKTFLEAFNLKMLSDLPTLREYHELTAENQAKVDAQAPKAEIGRIRDLARPDARMVSEEAEVEGSQAMAELDRAIGDASISTRTAEVLLKAGGKLPPGMKLDSIAPVQTAVADEVTEQLVEEEPMPVREEEDTDATSASEES